MAVSSVNTSSQRTSQPSAASTYTQPSSLHIAMEPDRSFDEEDANVLTQLAPIVEQFMSDCEYEEIETDNWRVHVAAGSLAGVGEHWIMYPIDLIKTRMMAIKPPPGARYSNMLSAFPQIVKGEGLLKMWRGGGVVVFGALPAHAMYFTVYEKGKEVTGRYLGHNSAYSHLLSGACAALVHDAVMTPTDAVKQRMQVYKSKYSSNRACVRAMYREGLGTFYRSYGTQICMNIPQQGIHFMLYEKFKRRMNPSGDYNVGAHVACGALAGGLAAFITTPLDVCKTFLNTQPACQSMNNPDKQITRGVLNGLRTISKVGGVSSLYKGCMPRTIHAMPSTGICWGVYETFKHIFKS